jgi:DNA-binding CsgD family transcriptional regulator
MRFLEIGTERIGYRLKERIAGVKVLTDTLDRIGAGEIVIEPVLAQRLLNRPARVAGPLASLSQREFEVLRLMAEGRSNTGIAATLFLSVKAVEKHVAGIFTKLDGVGRLPCDGRRHERSDRVRRSHRRPRRRRRRPRTRCHPHLRCCRQRGGSAAVGAVHAGGRAAHSADQRPVTAAGGGGEGGPGR